MKKRLLSSSFALFVVLVIVTTSCSSKKRNYLNVIPANATVVTSVNFKSLVEKSDISNYLKSPKTAQLTKQITQGLSNEASTLFTRLIEKPSSSGIDFSEKGYFFAQTPNRQFGDSAAVNQKDYLLGMGVVLSVSDVTQLTNTLKTIANESGIAPPTQSKEDDTYSLNLEDKGVIIYNNSTLLFFISDGGDMLQEAQKLITQEKENSIRHNLTFDKLEKSQSDVAFIINMSAIVDEYTTELADIRALYPDSCDLKDLGVLCELNFKKGEIVFSTETFAHSDAWKAYLKKGEGVMGKIDTKFLQFVPEDALVVVGLNMSGKKYKEEYGVTTNNLLDQLVSSNGIFALYKKFIENFTAIEGNAVAYVKGNSLQNITAQAFIEGKEKEINDLLLVFTTVADSIGHKDGYSYISYKATEPIGKKLDNSFAKTKAGEEFTKNQLSFYINMKEISKLLLSINNSNDPVVQMSIQVLLAMDYIILNQPNSSRNELKIVMTDKSKNALKWYMDLAMSTVN